MKIFEIAQLGWCYVSRHSNIPYSLKDLYLKPNKNSPPVNDTLEIVWLSQSFSVLNHKELLDICLDTWIGSSIWKENPYLLQSVWFYIQRHLKSPIDYVAFVDVKQELWDMQIEVLVYKPRSVKWHENM